MADIIGLDGKRAKTQGAPPAEAPPVSRIQIELMPLEGQGVGDILEDEGFIIATSAFVGIGSLDGTPRVIVPLPFVRFIRQVSFDDVIAELVEDDGTIEE